VSAIGVIQHGELTMTKRSSNKQAVFSRYNTKREGSRWNHPWAGSLSLLPNQVTGPASSCQSKFDNASSAGMAAGGGSARRSVDAIKHRRSISNIVGAPQQSNCADRKDDHKLRIRRAIDYYDQNRFFRWLQEGSLQKETAPRPM